MKSRPSVCLLVSVRLANQLLAASGRVLREALRYRPRGRRLYLLFWRCRSIPQIAQTPVATVIVPFPARQMVGSANWPRDEIGPIRLPRGMGCDYDELVAEGHLRS